ncbi:hypothetical protein [Bosea sp. AS-1]|uniref:hypothetical protein n=1 Tax=Bosea sp. AS-1 TaxID=2015316 RepID=UPI000B7929E3|nr:hypothetical protein [Bosea sp. AS-1]
MTRNDSRGPLAPHDNANGGQDGPAELIRDPLAAIAGSISDDPSVAELIAFRRSTPDLQAVAIDAKRCGDEAGRLLPGSHHPDPHNRAWVALAIAGLSCSAIVAIWPCDTVHDAHAKMALAEASVLHGDDAERGEAAMLDVTGATRIRIQRAAYAVDPLMVPPGPAAPSQGDRGLAHWPIRHFDLADLTPPSAGDILLSPREVARWGLFLKAQPSFEGRLARVEQMFAIADRLRVLARQAEDGARDLRWACEGALILAYMAAAQIAIWPALKHSPEAQAKERLVTVINARASRGDPAHMQAAIRHLVTEAAWPAHGWRPTATVVAEPDWIPIV